VSKGPTQRRLHQPPGSTEPHAQAVNALVAADARLGELIARVGACRLACRPAETPFEALLEAVIHQQLAANAASAIQTRVRALFPGGVPTPAGLVRLSEEQLRGAGLSRAKLASLKDLATRSLDGEIPGFEVLEHIEDEAIIEQLTRVRGIGRWTVEMLLIFRLGRPDVLPATDYGVRKGFALAYHARRRSKKARAALPTPTEVLAHGQRWRPYRSVATWYLWRSLDAASGDA